MKNKFNLGKIYCGNLSQHSFAFNNNLKNIKSSLNYCKQNEVFIKPGIELELTGCSLGNHFFEKNTYLKVFSQLKEIINFSKQSKMFIEIGTPLMYEEQNMNCLVQIFNGKILQIRPKQNFIPNSFSENQFFSKPSNLKFFELPQELQVQTGQQKVQIGNDVISFEDFTFCSIYQEELQSKLFEKYLKNKISFFNIVNSRVFEAGKLVNYLKNLQKISQEHKVDFLTHGQQGNEGGNFIFEGGSFLIQKGQIFELNERFDFKDTSNQDFKFYSQQYNHKKHKGIKIEENFFTQETKEIFKLKSFNEPIREKEIIDSICRFVWDKIKQTRCCGFFIPLSGGADSAVTSLLIYYFCQKIINSNEEIKNIFTNITGQKIEENEKTEDLVHKILFTFFLPMKFSSTSKNLAEKMAQRINSKHQEFSIQETFDNIKQQVEQKLDMQIDFKANNGTPQQDLALQNLQARSRLVLSYFISQILPMKYDLKSFLLVLATGNLSEVLRGYYTKYDNSSGDFDLVGSLDKNDIWALMIYGYENLENFQILKDIAEVPPTAQLTPQIGQLVQTDENDMGFNYEELCFLGYEWKVNKKSGYFLVESMMDKFQMQQNLAEQKVDLFLKYLFQNRHKSICLPPQIHLTNYNTEGFNDTRPKQYLLENNLQKKEFDEFKDYFQKQNKY